MSLENLKLLLFDKKLFKKYFILEIINLLDIKFVFI